MSTRSIINHFARPLNVKENTFYMKHPLPLSKSVKIQDFSLKPAESTSTYFISKVLFQRLGSSYLFAV